MTASWPDVQLETSFEGPVVGVDEVGCGPWAGPVVAAACCWHSYDDALGFYGHIRDSKVMSPRQRHAVLAALTNHPAVSLAVGMATVEEIDALNIRQAAFLAMTRAINALGVPDATILVDGIGAPAFLHAKRVLTVVKGDAKSLSIAAASIHAKQTRDALMTELSHDFPAYGWERNAGYGTRAHQEALNLHGATPHHRHSFKPVAQIVASRAATGIVPTLSSLKTTALDV